MALKCDTIIPRTLELDPYYKMVFVVIPKISYLESSSLHGDAVGAF